MLRQYVHVEGPSVTDSGVGWGTCGGPQTRSALLHFGGGLQIASARHPGEPSSRTQCPAGQPLVLGPGPTRDRPGISPSPNSPPSAPLYTCIRVWYGQGAHSVLKISISCPSPGLGPSYLHANHRMAAPNIIHGTAATESSDLPTCPARQQRTNEAILQPLGSSFELGNEFRVYS